MAVQVPAPFEYARATSVQHAVGLLARLGPEARIIAGGHSLLPMMKLRLARPEHLIDINDLDDLDYIRLEGPAGSRELAVGALTRHRGLLESDLVGRLFPIFHDAERMIADPLVRNRGTIGGSLCQADPSEDLSAVCGAVRALLVIQGVDQRRTVSMPDFHRGPYETAVGDGEMLVEIRIPVPERGGSAYEKVERRAGDWAVAAAGAAVVLAADGTFADVGLGVAAVGSGTHYTERAEAALLGQLPGDDVIASAADMIAADCEPAEDGRGSVRYKRHLAGELTRRALRRATTRAGGGGSSPNGASSPDPQQRS